MLLLLLLLLLLLSLLYYSQRQVIVERSCSNGKSPGIDGVRYEDIKNNWEEHGKDIVRLFNTILTNKKFPISWKRAIIQRIPKKNFNRNDLSTLRDISLLTTLYKVFLRCLWNRLIEFTSNEISFWQRTYLEKRDRQELIFNLITEIDDLKDLSTKMYVTFIDFAFGSVSHEFIFDSLGGLIYPKRIAP